MLLQRPVHRHPAAAHCPATAAAHCPAAAPAQAGTRRALLQPQREGSKLWLVARVARSWLVSQSVAEAKLTTGATMARMASRWPVIMQSSVRVLSQSSRSDASPASRILSAGSRDWPLVRLSVMFLPQRRSSTRPSGSHTWHAEFTDRSPPALASSRSDLTEGRH